MQILGIAGSMRKDGRTSELVLRVIEELRHLVGSVESDVVYVADKDINPCKVVCSHYCSTNAYRCSIPDDVPGILNTMVKADALIVGVPLYFRGPPAKFHALIERLVSMFFYRELETGGEAQSPLAGKPCALIGVAEYSNPHQLLEYLNDFCTVLKMRPVRLNRFPYLGVGGQGDLAQDEVFHPFERSKELAGAIVKHVMGKG